WKRKSNWSTRSDCKTTCSRKWRNRSERLGGAVADAAPRLVGLAIFVSGRPGAAGSVKEVLCAACLQILAQAGLPGLAARGRCDHGGRRWWRRCHFYGLQWCVGCAAKCIAAQAQAADIGNTLQAGVSIIL